MSTTKRILSLVLCAVMMVGVMAMGLYATAADGSTVKSFAELSSDYEGKQFIYQALRLYDENGNELTADSVLDVTKTYTIKIFFKSNCTIYGTTYLVAALDGDMFNAPVKTVGGSQVVIGKDAASAANKKAFAANNAAYSEIVCRGCRRRRETVRRTNRAPSRHRAFAGRPARCHTRQAARSRKASAQDRISRARAATFAVFSY